MINGNKGKLITIALLICFVGLAVLQSVLSFAGAKPGDLQPLVNVQTYIGMLMAGIFGVNAISNKDGK